MSYQAAHDPLTGLINRREFERRARGVAAFGVRDGEASHVLCYLDLDRFKAVNDTCGHMAGDNLLREISALIKDQVRESDFVARLGGDEFGMLLIGCPLTKARQIADDVIRAVQGLPVRLAGQDLHGRRQHRAGGNRQGERHDQGYPQRRGLGLLRGQAARARAGTRLLRRKTRFRRDSEARFTGSACCSPR